ncbi:ABC transporter ATP-binding protein [Desertivirga brevis]|uniref:ABC transporter ATP-binding protein n=1 Tax=Desertivirga brevis TaxID=2810310 RepID=UPI001A97B4D5|nr:ABC transporter ATP-binding protein [Pedobacter sp. SYSU D00873]
MARTSRNASQPTIKDRLRALRNLPAFFKLIWKSGSKIMLANITLRFIIAAIPFLLLYIGKLIIDQVIYLNRSHNSFAEAYLWKLVAFELALAILSDGLTRAITLMDSLLGELFANHTSIRIMEHAGTLDLDQFEDAVFYDKLERARQQTNGRTVLLSQVMSQLQDFITIGFLGLGLFVFNAWLVLLLIIAILPAFIGEWYFNDQTYALSRRQTPQRRELDYLRYIGASDDTAKEIKMFGLANFIIDRFRVLSDQFYAENKRISVRRSMWGTFFALLASLGYYGAYVLIIHRTVQGELTIGELTFLAGSFRQLRSLLESVLGRFTSVSQGAIYLKDFFDFFEIQPRILNTNNPRPFPNPIIEGFKFENVGFRYHHSERWANRNLNFTLHPSEKLALVGENGAGKSTLVKLLVRLYDPSEGRILLDGHDLREYDLNDLRKHIGIIFQDFIRYQMTFSQNIATGNIEEKSNEELIRRSAQQSLADDLAKKLPGGYEQVLGRRFAEGVELSGGEWQKVAIARAYMRNAKLVILDEPTSALDARAEYQVFERFTELTKGRMAVLISHRFSTVRMADRILVLDNGEVVEMGSHVELLEQKGRYAELFQLQAVGYQ